MASVSTYSLSTFIVGRHGYHSEPLATAEPQGSLVVKKSHAAHSHTLSVKAAASVRHVRVNSARSRSADASKTIVVLFVVCPLMRRRDTVLFESWMHKRRFLS